MIPSSCTTVRSLVTQASIVLRSSILFSCEDTNIEMWSNTINRQPRARTRYRIRLIIFSIVLEPKWSKKKNLEVPKVLSKASLYSSSVVSVVGKCNSLFKYKLIKLSAVVRTLSSINIKPMLSFVFSNI